MARRAMNLHGCALPHCAPLLRRLRPGAEEGYFPVYDLASMNGMAPPVTWGSTPFHFRIASCIASIRRSSTSSAVTSVLNRGAGQVNLPYTMLFNVKGYNANC